MLPLSDTDIRYRGNMKVRKSIFRTIGKVPVNKTFIKKFIKAYQFNTYKELNKLFGLNTTQSYAIVRRLRSHGFILPARKKTFELKVENIISNMKKK